MTIRNPIYMADSGKLQKMGDQDTIPSSMVSWSNPSVGVFADVPPTITDNGSGNITVGSTTVALAESVSVGAQISKYQVPSATFTIPADSQTYYVCARYSNGAASYYLEVLEGNINARTITPIYACWNILGVVSSQYFGTDGDLLANKIDYAQIDTVPYRRSISGGLTISENNLVWSATSALVYAGTTPLQISAMTASTSNLIKAYHAGGAWTYSVGSATYDNTNYDNGTALVALGNNKYGVRWIFRSVSNPAQLMYVLGTSYYSNYDAAASELMRTDLPELISKHCILIGKAIIQSGAAAGVTLSTFDVSFAGGAISSDHNALGGIYGDAPFYHLSQPAYTKINNITALSGTGLLKLTSGTPSIDSTSYWHAGNHPTALTNYGISSSDTLFDAKYLGISSNAVSSSKLANARTIALSGDGSWSVSFNGSANVTSALTLATVNSNVGSFGSATTIPTFTVNAKGLTTAASNVAIFIPHTQISDWNTATSGFLTGNQTIALTGIVTGSGTTSITTSIADGALSIAKTNGLQAALNSYLPLSGGTMNAGAKILTDKDMTISTSANVNYSNAPFVAQRNTHDSTTTTHASIGFHNVGANAAALFYHAGYSNFWFNDHLGGVYQLWSSKDFASQSITNWTTAYNWGNHASAGYLLASTAASTYLPISGTASNSSNLGGIAASAYWSSANHPTVLYNYGITSSDATLDGRYLQLIGGILTGSLFGVNSYLNANENTHDTAPVLTLTNSIYTLGTTLLLAAGPGSTSEIGFSNIGKPAGNQRWNIGVYNDIFYIGGNPTNNTGNLNPYTFSRSGNLGVYGSVTAANFIGNMSGNASSASKLATARTIALSGDGSWSVSFDGSDNVTGALTLTSLLTAGSAGSSTSVPVLAWDAKGRLTSGGSATISIPHSQISDWDTYINQPLLTTSYPSFSRVSTMYDVTPTTSPNINHVLAPLIAQRATNGSSTSMAGVGFRNIGAVGAFLYLNNSGHFQVNLNNGEIYSLIDSYNYPSFNNFTSGLSTTTLTASGLITANGGISGNLTGNASTASAVAWTGITSKPDGIDNTGVHRLYRADELAGTPNHWLSHSWSNVCASYFGWNSWYLTASNSYNDQQDGIHTVLVDYARLSVDSQQLGGVAASSYLLAATAASTYLPLGGTASNASALGGISSDYFVQGSNSSRTTLLTDAVTSQSQLFKSGFYCSPAWTDAPVTSTWTHLIHSQYANDVGTANGYSFDIAANFAGKVGNGENYYVRAIADGTSTGWRTLIHSANYPSFNNFTSGISTTGITSYGANNLNLISDYSITFRNSNRAYLTCNASAITVTTGITATGYNIHADSFTADSTIKASGLITANGGISCSGTFAPTVINASTAITIDATYQGKMVIVGSAATTATAVTFPATGPFVGFWFFLSFRATYSGNKYGPASGYWWLNGTSQAQQIYTPFSGIVSWTGNEWVCG